MDNLNIFKNEQDYATAIAENPDLFFNEPTVTLIEEVGKEKCYIEPVVTGKTGRPDATGLKEIGWGGDDIKRLHKDLDTFVDVPQSDKNLSSQGMDMSKTKKVTKYCPMFDTSKVTNMHEMFFGCQGLTSVPQFDTSNVTDMSYAFSASSKNLGSIPFLNTSKVTNMNHLFGSSVYQVSGLKKIPQFDTSKVTNMVSMFQNCSSLTTVPQFNTSNVTDMTEMFSGCESLTSVPQFDTSKVTDMREMFDRCSNLTSIPELNCKMIDGGSLYDISSGMVGAFRKCTNLQNLGGFLGIRKPINLSDSNKLTHESLVNVINKSGLAIGERKMILGNVNLSKLSPGEKRIATNKGWTLS